MLYYYVDILFFCQFERCRYRLNYPTCGSTWPTPGWKWGSSFRQLNWYAPSFFSLKYMFNFNIKYMCLIIFSIQNAPSNSITIAMFLCCNTSPELIIRIRRCKNANTFFKRYHCFFFLLGYLLQWSIIRHLVSGTSFVSW